jgi:hypothetical protein
VTYRIGLLLAVLAVAGCGANQSSAPPRSTSATANVSLPPSIAECETLIPLLSRDQALVRIYDYGQRALAPRAHRVGLIKPGAVSPVQQANGRVGGFNEARVSYDGHTLLIDTSYGSTHPPAAVRAQVAALLRGVVAGSAGPAPAALRRVPEGSIVGGLDCRPATGFVDEHGRASALHG